jgi:sulfotransferase family protein
MLEVIGTGLGRTGTTSLKAALELLGFAPCHTMLGLFSDPDSIATWRHASRGASVDWRRLYADYRASVDWPGAKFWREITAAFPAAKVVLTVRDADAWYDSVRSSIYAASMEPLPESGADPTFAQVWHMSREVVWDGVFDGKFEDRDHAIAVYHAHNEAVRQEIDPERLLVFEVQQGWGPLCAFLGVDQPGQPFPRTNDRNAFGSRIERLKTGPS